MKKILIVSQHFPPERTGNSSRIHDIGTFLRSLGNDVCVVAPHPTFPSGSFPRTWKRCERDDSASIPCIRLWTWQPGSEDPGFLEKVLYYVIFPIHATIWLLLNGKGFDVIITSAPPLFTHIPGLFGKKVFGKGWIMDVRDLWIDAAVGLGFIRGGGLLEAVSRKFEQICMVHADFIGVTTQELGKNLSTSDEIRKKIIHVPNGVDTAVFRPNGSSKKNRIIYSGNIGHAQDLEVVIRAFQEINLQYGTQLLLVGDGEIRSTLEELARSECCGDSVVFRGTVDRETVSSLISESLLGLAPLKNMKCLEYAAPTKVYEYMACNVPFLACGKGEISTLARESSAGIIVENTKEAMTSALRDLLGNTESLEAMGKRGREYVQEHYERSKIAEHLNAQIQMIQ